MKAPNTILAAIIIISQVLLLPATSAARDTEQYTYQVMLSTERTSG